MITEVLSTSVVGVGLAYAVQVHLAWVKVCVHIRVRECVCVHVVWA